MLYAGLCFLIWIASRISASFSLSVAMVSIFAIFLSMSCFAGERSLDFEKYERTRLRSLAAFPEDIHCGWQNFEKWYTGDSATRFLSGFPAYSCIAKHFQAVRTYASILLGQPQVASPIEQSVFDAFMEQSHLLEWQVWRLHQEVRDLLSAIDPLTGVSSRKGMISRLQQEQQRVLFRFHFYPGLHHHGFHAYPAGRA